MRKTELTFGSSNIGPLSIRPQPTMLVNAVFDLIRGVDMLWIASILCGLTTLAHVLWRGPLVARPLVNSSIDPMVKYNSYYGWHVITITMAALTVAFWRGATNPELGWFATAIAAGYAVWGLVLPPLVGQSYAKIPQGWLFLLVAILGAAGLLL